MFQAICLTSHPSTCTDVLNAKLPTLKEKCLSHPSEAQTSMPCWITCQPLERLTLGSDPLVAEINAGSVTPPDDSCWTARKILSVIKHTKTSEPRWNERKARGFVEFISFYILCFLHFLEVSRFGKVCFLGFLLLLLWTASLRQQFRSTHTSCSSS